jgi:hypothetical protein
LWLSISLPNSHMLCYGITSNALWKRWSVIVENHKDGWKPQRLENKVDKAQKIELEKRKQREAFLD